MAIDIQKINDTPHLLDILIQMEDILDSFDIYVFENWKIGEVVDGPRVKRYWFEFTLQYPIDKMPDSKGAHRLLKHGIRVNYDKINVKNDDGSEPESPNFWNVNISIPTRLISDMNAAELDVYGEDIDVEDVQSAQDEGMTNETGISDGNDEFDDGFSNGEENGQ